MNENQGTQSKTIAQALQSAAQSIIETQQTNAKLEAEILLAFVLGKPRTHFYTWPEECLEEGTLNQFSIAVQRRCAGEPIAYITGTREFWGLPLKVTPDTLIPRPETERLVEIALEHIPEDRPSLIADLGTGSGAIALAIASERTQATIVASDANESTLEVAKINCADLKLTNISFLHGHWFDAFEKRSDEPHAFNLIISNPPYVAEQDPHLQQGDLRFEPQQALSSGPDGLQDIREIISKSREHLESGGYLLLEHGADQADRVIDLFEKSGYSRVQCFRDYAERERATIGCWLK